MCIFVCVCEKHIYVYVCKTIVNMKKKLLFIKIKILLLKNVLDYIFQHINSFLFHINFDLVINRNIFQNIF